MPRPAVVGGLDVAHAREFLGIHLVHLIGEVAHAELNLKRALGILVNPEEPEQGEGFPG